MIQSVSRRRSRGPYSKDVDHVWAGNTRIITSHEFRPAFSSISPCQAQFREPVDCTDLDRMVRRALFRWALGRATVPNGVLARPGCRRDVARRQLGRAPALQSAPSDETARSLPGHRPGKLAGGRSARMERPAAVRRGGDADGVADAMALSKTSRDKRSPAGRTPDADVLPLVGEGPDGRDRRTAGPVGDGVLGLPVPRL
jgi:hypothetical protein